MLPDAFPVLPAVMVDGQPFGQRVPFVAACECHEPVAEPSDYLQEVADGILRHPRGLGVCERARGVERHVVPRHVSRQGVVEEIGPLVYLV